MPNNRIVNFQMQQPGDMANPQVVGIQQQNRLSLAERLRKYGLGQDESGAQSFANSFNQQAQMGQSQDTPMSPQQQASQSAPMEKQLGMMGLMSRGARAIGRGASDMGSSISKGFGSAAGSLNKLFS